MAARGRWATESLAGRGGRWLFVVGLFLIGLACARCGGGAPGDGATRPAEMSSSMSPGAAHLPRAIQIATIPDIPVHLALDAQHVYWTSTYNDGPGRVSRVRKRGGSVEVLAASQPSPFALAVDKDSVYWSNLGAAGARGSIYRLPKGGGVPVVVSDQEGPTNLALSSDALYFISAQPARVRRLSVNRDGGNGGGGEATSVITDPLEQTGSAPDGLVADGADVYWTNFGTPGPSTFDGSVETSSGGGAARVIARGIAHPQTPILCGDALYFLAPVPPLDAERRTFEIRALSPKTLATQVVLRRDGDWQPQLACDARFLYFAERGPADQYVVFRVARQGGTPEPWSRPLRGLNHMIADDSGLYLAVPERILKIPQPPQLAARSITR